MITFTWIGLTYNSGKTLPDKTTLVEPICCGNGKPVLPAEPSAKPLPKIETSNPKAGELVKSPELTTAPAPTIGTLGFDDTCPVTCTLPVSGNCWASARTVNPLELWAGTQVPAQVPLPVESRLIGESPSLKLTITDPVLNGTSQSSTTCTMIGVGQAAGVLKPVPIVVNTGSSLVAVHGAVVGVAAARTIAVLVVPVITKSRSTICVLPSPKVSWIEPL